MQTQDRQVGRESPGSAEVSLSEESSPNLIYFLVVLYSCVKPKEKESSIP